MKNKRVEKKMLVTSKEFKAFWKESNGFAYALTSSEFPPVLLEEEQWLFSNDLTALLKDLMQFKERKMKLIKAPFNPAKKAVLRPDSLCEWKINHFPEEWNVMQSQFFIPEGHLTKAVLASIDDKGETVCAEDVEHAFFTCLATEIEEMGYVLLSPEPGKQKAKIHAYLKEWEADEKDAGLA